MASHRKFSPDRFDRLCVFFRHRMQKWRPSEVFIMFFCKKSRNSCLLIFVRSMSLNTTTVERILFFDFFTIFCEPFLKLERIWGGVQILFPAAAGFWPLFQPRQKRGQKNFEMFFVPVRGMNRDERGTLWSRFMSLTGMNAPRGHPSRLMPITGMNDPK